MALTEQQQKFLQALLADPQRSTRAAALKADVSEGSAKTTGRRWAKLREVVEALEQRATSKAGTKRVTKRSRPLLGKCDPSGFEESLEVECETHRRGRPKVYTPEIAERICYACAHSTKSLETLCREREDFPSARTVYRWCRDSTDFCQLLTRAREDRADFIYEQALKIADEAGLDTYIDDQGHLRVDHENINRSKLKVDTRLKICAKLNPKKYGQPGKGRGGVGVGLAERCE